MLSLKNSFLHITEDFRFKSINIVRLFEDNPLYNQMYHKCDSYLIEYASNLISREELKFKIESECSKYLNAIGV